VNPERIEQARRFGGELCEIDACAELGTLEHVTAHLAAILSLDYVRAETRDHLVTCHLCVAGSAEHPRSTSRLIGSPSFGGLWHCPAHATCRECPRGSWTEPAR
jgi:hypothetical protein